MSRLDHAPLEAHPAFQTFTSGMRRTPFDVRMANAPKGLKYGQWRFKFPNGYGASVVRNDMSYGRHEGLFELAVLDLEGELDYSTPITSDVLGSLTTDEVLGLLEQIAQL